jgi:hypothetical protein
LQPAPPDRSPMTIVSAWQALALGQQPLELTVVLGPEGLETRNRRLTIGLLPQADWIRFDLLALARNVHTVDTFGSTLIGRARSVVSMTVPPRPERLRRVTLAGYP